MAQVIKMIVPAGAGTITAKKINISSDAVVETSSSVTRSTNGGIYSASFTDSTTGTFLFRLYDDGVAFASIVIAIDAASGTWGETEDIDSEVKKIPRAAATLTAGEFSGKITAVNAGTGVVTITGAPVYSGDRRRAEYCVRAPSANE